MMLPSQNIKSPQHTSENEVKEGERSVKFTDVATPAPQSRIIAISKINETENMDDFIVTDFS